jgi:hypothetical protein
MANFLMHNRKQPILGEITRCQNYHRNRFVQNDF